MDENFDIKEEDMLPILVNGLMTESNCAAIYGQRHYHRAWTEEEKRKN